MSCRLCQLDRPLRQSHIIPEFMYEAVYDGKHRFSVYKIDGGSRPEIAQKGAREALLCDDCEQRLQGWERYIAHLWQGIEPVQSSREGRLVTLTGIDYKRFKLFQMSVLWRASVAAHPFFSQVDLGEKHTEAIRSRLLAQDPGRAIDVGCAMAAVVHENEPLRGLIMQPTPIRFEGFYCHRFVFGGMTWICVVSSHRPPDNLAPLFAQEDGTVRFVVGELREAEFLTQAVLDIVRNNPKLR